jgi:hypothetical protein
VARKDHSDIWIISSSSWFGEFWKTDISTAAETKFFLEMLVETINDVPGLDSELADILSSPKAHCHH